MRIDPDTLELATLYADDRRLPLLVCVAFVAADLEPPPRERVDRIGYNARERAIIAPYLSTPET